MQSFAGVFDLGEARPALVIVLVHLQELIHREGSGLQQVTRFEHEGEVGVGDLVRFLLAGYKLLVGISIRTMWGHSGMQGGTSRAESFSLRIIFSADVSHKLRHAIPVIIRRFEGVLGHQPSGRKDHEIQSGSAVL